MFSMFKRNVLPTEPAVYSSHKVWAGLQPFSAESTVAYVQSRLNPILHHCRIGKITLKAKAGG